MLLAAIVPEDGIMACIQQLGLDHFLQCHYFLAQDRFHCTTTYCCSKTVDTSAYFRARTSALVDFNCLSSPQKWYPINFIDTLLSLHMFQKITKSSLFDTPNKVVLDFLMFLRHFLKFSKKHASCFLLIMNFEQRS